jgi:hypothetical protein
VAERSERAQRARAYDEREARVPGRGGAETPRAPNHSSHHYYEISSLIMLNINTIVPRYIDARGEFFVPKTRHAIR